jgi:NAD(P)H-dependent FMN reductase
MDARDDKRKSVANKMASNSRPPTRPIVEYVDVTAHVRIGIIIGSTRPKRFSEKPAEWIYDEVRAYDEVEVELLDLRDHPLPFFEEPESPASKKHPYDNPLVRQWTTTIASLDGFIIVTPEYNHGYPAVLKNALDYVYQEWNGKAVGFVSYGNASGARSVEQLRQVAIELQMAPIRPAVHIPGSVQFPIMAGKAAWQPTRTHP